MATFSKQILSGSLNGRGTLVAATASPGTTIHATGTSSAIIDEIWIYAHNTSGSDVKLTLEYGGTTSPDDLVEFTVKAESGLYLIVPGVMLTGTGVAANTIRAFAATTNVINLFGYVNRIT